MWPKLNPFTNAKSVARPHRNGQVSAPDVRHGAPSSNLFKLPSPTKRAPGGRQMLFPGAQNYLPLNQSGLPDLDLDTQNLIAFWVGALFLAL